MRISTRFFLRTAFILVPALGSCHTTLPPMQALGQEGLATHYACGSQQLLLLRGTPFEMGYQHGRLLADQVQIVVEEVLQWTEDQGLDRGDSTAVAPPSRAR